MSDYIEVIAIVEGKTEQVFVESVLQPYLAQQNIFISATQVSKPGQKGGDVRFSRVSRDIERHLKQRPDTYVTTLVDYYGVKEWPGLDTLPAGLEPARIAEHLNGTVRAKVVNSLRHNKPIAVLSPLLPCMNLKLGCLAIVPFWPQSWAYQNPR